MQNLQLTYLDCTSPWQHHHSLCGGETMREKSITGKYIGNAIGYCHCKTHKGALNKELAYRHKCIAKKCKYLEKYSEEQWRKKEKYVR